MVDSKWYTAVSKLIELLKSSTSGEEDRTLAAKELAGLAASDSTNERMNRQNMIVDTGAGIPLVRQMVEGKSEEERWWAALALVQLTFGNERTIERLIDASVLGDTSKIVKRWMIGDEAVENEVIDQEDRECVVRAATKILSNEVAYSTDRIKYGAMHILTNIANKCWDVHDIIFMHGAVRRVVPLCKSSNTPALVAAGVGLLCSMSYREGSRSRLIKAGAVRVLEPIARTERADLSSISANIARTNLRRHAASVMVALARGYFERKRLKKEARDRKMRRLAGFMGSLVFYKCFLVWVDFKLMHVEHRKKMNMSVKRLLNRTLIWALQNLSRYVDHRRRKYDQTETALEFAFKSKGCTQMMLAMWKEFMRKDGSWWKPDSELEAHVKNKCASFVALMSGQWLGLTFSAWKEQLQKKHRAMKRWQNSSTYYGFMSWTEYMYTEGAWWEPDDELKRLLDEKCGRFLAAMSGNYMQSAFREWDQVVRKKKRAMKRWLNRSMTNSFDEWHDRVFVEAYGLYEEVAQKCGKVLALISGEYLSICFHSWREHVEMINKGRGFLLTIKNKPLQDAWDGWVCFMCQGSWWEPDDDMQAQLDQKCGTLIAMMSGDFSRLMLTQWYEIAHKQRLAMLRWKNQSVFAVWKCWLLYHEWEGTRRRRVRIVSTKRRLECMREHLWEFISCVDESLHRRSLISDAVHMWLNFKIVWAFRSLDDHCQTEKHHRMVLDRFRNRFRMRPAQLCLRALQDYTDKQVHLRFLMHRIKNKVLVSCLHLWQDMLQEVRIHARTRMVEKSALLMRWLKRPMISCFHAWKEYVEQEVRNRRILRKMKFRMEMGCVVEMFHFWNLYIDSRIAERYAELKEAIADALCTGTFSVLVFSLKKEHQLFHRSNVRWNDFVKSYMEDAMAEFSAEEASRVQNVYKRIRARKIQRVRENQEKTGTFEYISKTKGGSLLPPKRRGNGRSPLRYCTQQGIQESQEQAMGDDADFAAGSPPRAREPAGGIRVGGGARGGMGGQIAPSYMQRSGAFRGLTVKGIDLVLEGGHMLHQLKAKERRFKDERERVKRAALRIAQEEHMAQNYEEKGVDKPSIAPPSTRRAKNATSSLKDAQELSTRIGKYKGYSEGASTSVRRPVLACKDGGECAEVVSRDETRSREVGQCSKGLKLPAIDQASHSMPVAEDDADWPWIDRQAVLFALGVDEAMHTMPRLIPQRSVLIL